MSALCFHLTWTAVSLILFCRVILSTTYMNCVEFFHDPWLNDLGCKNIDNLNPASWNSNLWHPCITAVCTLQTPYFIDGSIVWQLKVIAGQTEHVIIPSVLYDPNFFASNVDCFGQCLSAHQPSWLPNSTYFHLGFLFSICWRDTSSKDITGQSAKDFLHQFPFSHICLFYLPWISCSFTNHQSAAVFGQNLLSRRETAVTMWPMAISVVLVLAALSGPTVAFNTAVKTCCPPGQFLAIEDWQESRQTVEGIWYFQNPAGIIPFPKLALMDNTQTSPEERLFHGTTIGRRGCRSTLWIWKQRIETSAATTTYPKWLVCPMRKSCLPSTASSAPPTPVFRSLQPGMTGMQTESCFRTEATLWLKDRCWRAQVCLLFPNQNWILWSFGYFPPRWSSSGHQFPSCPVHALSTMVLGDGELNICRQKIKKIHSTPPSHPPT